ncbi:hypothetical protein OS493_032879 [Desmophyllum pertusum]|uniref:Uncharacterized protein n=1 Tax=Desmophyllum pertusum TaxID=174260 RepID=A0A9X0CIB9_9CNID|nr:hypothetical protein OS493_032879 [Desmophyllum pertusum]
MYRTYCPTRSDSHAQGGDVMIKLRLGLMKLLEMKLFNLPSEHVPAVIGEVLKAEYMLVWAYHDADNVREFAIRILFQYLQKAEPKRREQFLRNPRLSFVSQPVTIPVQMTEDLALSVRPMGVGPSVGPHLCQLFIRVDDLCLQAVDHGLLETLCNVVYGLCSLQHRQRFVKNSSGIPYVDTIMERFTTVCSLHRQESMQEEQDHKKRDHDPSTSYCARYFRLFAVQVALHFFQEVSKGEVPVGGKKTKPSGLR